MLFNSFEYFAFLALSVVIYFSLPFRFRVWYLLPASYYFYMRWRWEYAFLMLVQTFITHETARRIARSTDPAVRKFWLRTALVTSFGILGYYKYFNFFNDSFREVFNALGVRYLVPHLDILLPVGISFFTFQTLSYTIDVYRKAHGVEPHFGRYALYVAFFPQLVAGPIERATHLLDQFKRRNHFNLTWAVEGGKLILWGLFKKVVIADRLAIYVDRVYATPDAFSGSTLLLATYFFAFQIYCDFSGYSDMAIGSARVLGYDIMQNFRLPYLARSIAEFWKRWHISLTSWFSSYVYIPLGGKRVSYGRWLRNVSVVFLLSGLWHGANWTFVIWGALHATYYFLESLVKRARAHFTAFEHWWHTRIASVVRTLVIFHAVLLAWVFFRASSLADAKLILSKILSNPIGSPLYMGASQITLYLSVGLVGLLLAVQLAQHAGYASLYFSPSRAHPVLRRFAYVAMGLAVAMLGVSSNAFIYFQF